MEDIMFWVDWIFIAMSTTYMIMSDADSLVFTVVPVISAVFLAPQASMWYTWDWITYDLFLLLFLWAGILAWNIRKTLQARKPDEEEDDICDSGEDNDPWHPARLQLLQSSQFAGADHLR